VKEDINEYVNAYHHHGLWVPGRRIYLKAGDDDGDPEVNHVTSESFIKNIDILQSMSSDPITVVINTGGGNDVDGKAIYDIVKASPCHMVGIAVGECASSGITILQAFDERLAYKSTYFLVHDGSLTVSGSMRDVERQVEANRQIRLDYYRLLEESTKRPHQYWSRKLQQDYCLNAQQALAESLIDRII
jgi:ATP-dependent protease ClpP protease subunit